MHLRFKVKIFTDFGNKQFVEIALSFYYDLVGLFLRRDGFNFNKVIPQAAIRSRVRGLCRLIPKVIPRIARLIHQKPEDNDLIIHN
jgi:hypothetical protein